MDTISKILDGITGDGCIRFNDDGPDECKYCGERFTLSYSCNHSIDCIYDMATKLYYNEDELRRQRRNF